MNIEETLRDLQKICLEHNENCPNYNGDYNSDECDCPLFKECDLIYGLGFPCDLFYGTPKE